ncbi:hypothetical protein [Bacillus cereus]|uniref:hypothetical protein n=1 Tax=Bacillus cereus group TaxID=86661 RepID=UPI001F57F655|nr:hypothetical protein [Bacillus cereus]
MSLGLTFVSVGITFLVLSLTVSLPTVLWAVSLGTSIVLNFTGTTILMQFIKKQKRVYCEVTMNSFKNK